MQSVNKRRIGVDLMGSENAPTQLLRELKALLLPEDTELVLIGRPDLKHEAAPLLFIEANHEIVLEDHPLLALRQKRNSSISVALRLLKEGKIDALIAGGNTGALVSSAKIILGTSPGIARPALLALMPTKQNLMAVLDVGANIQVNANHLVQFAKLGSDYQKTQGIQEPKIGLLNIGSEPLKGTSELRLAYNELKKLPNFIGNIEAKEAFDGHIDVLVTDGFTGNIFLKTAEGVANLLKSARAEDERTGAILAGINGTVIKCHSYATPAAFCKAVMFAAGHLLQMQVGIR